MWGQDLTLSATALHRRIIPTRVGTSLPQLLRAPTHKDHPHACGDKIDVLYALNAKEIEPAATKRRGLGVETDSASTGSKISIADFLDDVKNYYSDVLSDSVRIISTRVGTRNQDLKLTELSQDHLHACGDKRVLLLPSLPEWGSSPRVWGQDTDTLNISINTRIIPTRVGTRNFTTSKPTIKQDHPHACGDKILLF